MAVEDKLVALLKVTVPGPETLDQVFVKVLPEGNPSSVAVPVREAVLGKVMVWSTPALTEGGWFTGIVMVNTTEATAESVIPAFWAMALTVEVLDTLKAAL